MEGAEFALDLESLSIREAQLDTVGLAMGRVVDATVLPYAILVGDMVDEHHLAHGGVALRRVGVFVVTLQRAVRMSGALQLEDLHAVAALVFEDLDAGVVVRQLGEVVATDAVGSILRHGRHGEQQT